MMTPEEEFREWLNQRPSSKLNTLVGVTGEQAFEIFEAGRNAGLEAAAVKVHELTGNSSDADDIRALKTAETGQG